MICSSSWFFQIHEFSFSSCLEGLVSYRTLESALVPTLVPARSSSGVTWMASQKSSNSWTSQIPLSQTSGPLRFHQRHNYSVQLSTYQTSIIFLLSFTPSIIHSSLNILIPIYVYTVLFSLAIYFKSDNMASTCAEITCPIPQHVRLSITRGHRSDGVPRLGWHPHFLVFLRSAMN